MQTRTKWIASSVLAAGVISLGTGIVVASGSDDNDEPITGEALERATAAALEATGGGEVTETEVGDEDSFYEVEVTLPDGSQVDVQLDEQFAVVDQQPDSDDPDDGDD